VLPVCVGKATRLARFLGGGVKEYQATVRLGFATATDDATGERIGALSQVSLDEAAVRAACARLVGESLQIPPAYSAKHVGGRHLHEMARAGIAVERTAAPVTVFAMDVIAISGDRLELVVRCSTGTYVRALARDIGEALGVGGHLEALRRTRSGDFDLASAISWEQVAELRSGGLVPMGRLLGDMPAVTVGADGVAALRHGRALGRGQVLSGFPEGPAPERLRVLGSDGESLLALAVPRGFGASPGISRDPVLQPDLVLLD
jgi:tRNA pseudouridine55 synthase